MFDNCKYQLGYFAHSKQKYNTVEERNEFEFIKKNFYGLLICPNVHIGELGGIEPYLDIVKKGDILFTSEFEGKVGRGVYFECKLALEMKIPVYVVKLNKIKYCFERLNGLDIINQNDFKSYAKLISKKIRIKKTPL